MEQLKKHNVYKQLCILSVLSMVFVSILLCSDILLYKIVDIFGIGISLSTFCSPVSYAVGNIITECFGKLIALLTIMAGLCVELLSGMIISFSSHVANQFNHIYQQSFSIALGGLGWLAICAALAGLLGYTASALVMVKLKKVPVFNEFIVRAIIATFIGEVIFVVIAYSFYLMGSPLHLSVLIKILAFSFVFKLLFAFVYSILSNYIVGWMCSSEISMA